MERNERLCLNPLFVGEPFPPEKPVKRDSVILRSLNPLFVGEPFPPAGTAHFLAWTGNVSIPSSSGNPFRRGVRWWGFIGFMGVSIPSSSGNPFRLERGTMNATPVRTSQSPLRRGTLSARSCGITVEGEKPVSIPSSSGNPFRPTPHQYHTPQALARPFPRTPSRGGGGAWPSFHRISQPFSRQEVIFPRTSKPILWLTFARR